MVGRLYESERATTKGDGMNCTECSHDILKHDPQLMIEYSKCHAGDCKCQVFEPCEIIESAKILDKIRYIASDIALEGALALYLSGFRRVKGQLPKETKC